MTGAVHDLLAQCVAGKSPENTVFTRPDGKPVGDFRNTWAKATEAAGVPGLLFHDLRRTIARNLRRAGIAEGIIMKIGGWRTRSVFDALRNRFANRHCRYAKKARSELRVEQSPKH